MKTTQKWSKASGRKTMFLAGMAAMALTFGLVLAGCGGDDGSGGTPDGGEVLPASSGENALSGKTYFRQDRKIVFAATESGAASGTYTVWGTTPTEIAPAYAVLEDGKFKYTEAENGTYSWDDSTEKVTLKPAKVAEDDGDGAWTALMDRTAYRTFWQERLNQLKQQYGEAVLNAELASMGFSSVAEYIDDAVKRKFANKTDGYSFSTDGVALFLDEPLPANKGQNELNGKEFTSTSPSTTDKVVFTSLTEYSVKNSSDAVIETGEYRYDTSDVDETNGTRVYLKPLTKNSKTVAQYYDSLGSIGVGYYESADAAKAAHVNDNFAIDSSRYKLSPNTIRY